VLLDGGRVLAEGAVEEISLYPELQGIIGPELVGAVIEGLVTRVNAETGSAELAVGTGTLHVSLRGVRPGARIRLQLLARDVILATQPVQGLSVRNALASTIIAISDDEFGAVLVRVDACVLAMLCGRSSRPSRRADIPSRSRRAAECGD
jgi:molybdate transport system ATP-binding protein